MKFSVIVPATSPTGLLHSCLDSISQSNLDRAAFEVLVIGQGLVPGAGEAAAAFGFRYVDEPNVQSAYAAANAALRHASGAFMVFTEPDCIVASDWLEHFDRLTGDDAIGCMAGTILPVEVASPVEAFADSVKLWAAGGPLSIAGDMLYARIANAAYRRTVLDELGGFDESLGEGAEADLACRMLEKTKFQVKQVPEAVVRRRFPQSIEELYARFVRHGANRADWERVHGGEGGGSVAESLKDSQQSLSTAVSTICEDPAVNPAAKSSLLSAATQVATLTAYLESVLKIATKAHDLGQAVPRALGRERFCNICGSTRFKAAHGRRLINGWPPQCVHCGSLPRHRTLYRAFDYLYADRMRDNKALVCGERIPGQLPFGESIYATPKEVIEGSPLQRFDIVMTCRYFEALPEVPFEEAIMALLSNCKQSGAWIGTEARRPLSFYEKIRQALPHATVFVKTLPDPVTEYKTRVLIAFGRTTRVLPSSE